ncbi:MAG: hypothetical protein ABI790_08530 [Betaproteobacteria bacterium]
MLMLTLPVAVLALVPVVLVEAMIGRRMLGLGWREAIKVFGIANLHSTFWGIPLTWLALLLLETLVGFTLVPLFDWESLPKTGLLAMQIFSSPLMSAWIGPGNPWDVYIAFVGLSLPFCVASIFIERWSVNNQLTGVPFTAIKRALIWGNVSSYFLLCLGFLAFPLGNS